MPMQPSDSPIPPPGPPLPTEVAGLPLEAFPLGISVVDGQGRILQTNAAASRLLGLSPAEPEPLTILSPAWKLFRADGSPMALEDHPGRRALQEQGRVEEAEVGMQGPGGDLVWLSITAVPLGPDRVLLTYGDVSETHRSKAILAARARLAEQASGLSLEQLLRATLDEAEALTGSCIGFYHFVEEDQENLRLQAWSTRTEAEFCRAEGKGSHYPLTQAGLWADCVRLKCPQIHNDYASLPNRKDLPPGHASVVRLLTVPVLRAGKAVAIVGVGNKAGEYRGIDVDMVQRLADLAWDLAESKRAQEALRRSALRYAALFNAAPLGIALSQQGTYLQANPAFLSLYGHHQEAEILGRPLLDDITEDQRDFLRARNQAREQTGAGPVEYETVGLRTNGTTFPMHLHVTSVQLENGTGTLAFISDISERRQIEARLRDSEERFRSYVEQSIDVIFTLDAQGVFTFVSPAWERHFGFPVSEVIGRPFSPFVHPEDVQPSMDYLRRVLSTGQIEGSPPFRVRRADGAWRWFTANGAPMATPGGERQFIGVAHDMTESRRAEVALRESERRFEDMAINTPGVVYQLCVHKDGTSHFNYVSPKVTEVFGFSADGSSTDWDMGAHVHPDDKESFMASVGRAIRDVTVWNFEGRFLTPKGVMWFQGLSRPTAEGDDLIFNGILIDITERRRLEEERLAIEQSIQQTQKMESLGSLAGGVAHDMNNVLGAILGLASAHLETQPEGSPAHRAFETIIKAAERGGTTVRSLLSLARQSPSEQRELDLNAILRDEVRLLERTTLAQVHLRMDLAPDLRPILGDVGALTHAFMNLCVNAVEAMPENGTLTLATRNVGSDGIEVRVEDDGFGMPKDILDKALDPFFTTKGIGKGTGLGLSLVYSTVKAHRGEMELQSEPGQGTRVTLRFPACDPSQEARMVLQPRPEPPGPKLHVLLVDDDELVQSATQAVLEALGHKVTPALSGEEALAALEAGLMPDVVLLDMNMPGLGGSGTLPCLRALRPTLPVLLATGRADQKALDLVAAHPRVSLLSKPFSMKDLQRHLEILGRGTVEP